MLLYQEVNMWSSSWLWLEADVAASFAIRETEGKDEPSVQISLLIGGQSNMPALQTPFTLRCCGRVDIKKRREWKTHHTYTVLCKRLQPLFTSLYFVIKMCNWCTDSWRRANISADSEYKTSLMSLKVDIWCEHVYSSFFLFRLKLLL